MDLKLREGFVSYEGKPETIQFANPNDLDRALEAAVEAEKAFASLSDSKKAQDARQLGKILLEGIEEMLGPELRPHLSVTPEQRALVTNPTNYVLSIEPLLNLPSAAGRPGQSKWSSRLLFPITERLYTKAEEFRKQSKGHFINEFDPETNTSHLNITRCAFCSDAYLKCKPAVTLKKCPCNLAH